MELINFFPFSPILMMLTVNNNEIKLHTVMLTVNNINKIANSIKHRHFRINRDLIEVKDRGPERPLMTSSIIKIPCCYLRAKHLKLTKSRCPRSEGRTTTYYH